MGRVLAIVPELSVSTLIRDTDWDCGAHEAAGVGSAYRPCQRRSCLWPARRRARLHDALEARQDRIDRTGDWGRDGTRRLDVLKSARRMSFFEAMVQLIWA